MEVAETERTTKVRRDSSNSIGETLRSWRWRRAATRSTRVFAAGISLGVVQPEFVNVAGVAPIIIHSAAEDRIVTIPVRS